MSPIIRRQFNGEQPSPNRFESHPDAISQTIPDQSMSVRELMKRHVQGLPLGGAKVPIYEGEEFVPDFAHMDLADRQELIEAAREELAEIRQRANEKALKVKQKREADAIQKAYERLKAEGKIGLPPKEAKPSDPI